MSPNDCYRYAMQQVTCCFLCGRPRPAFLAAFISNTPAPWPGPPLPPGKVRSFWYGLCRRCFRRKDKVEAVETKILDSFPTEATRH